MHPTPSRKTAEVKSRVEPEIKDKAVRYLNKYDISLSHAIKLFLLEVIEQKGLPFDLRLRPGDREAIDEIEYAIKHPHKVKTYKTYEEAKRAMDAEDEE